MISTRHALLVSSLLFGLADHATRAAITGQWDFNSDLSATIGQPIQPMDPETEAGSRFGTTTSFGIPGVNGQEARVMQFPKTGEFGGYIVSHGAAPNGEGFYVNQYTIIMDVLFPLTSTGLPRSLVQADNSGNGEYQIGSNNGIGTDGGPYDGAILANTWHRIVFAADFATSPATVGKFVDGVKVGENTVNVPIDGRYSLDFFFILFNDDTGEVEPGYINSLQFRDQKLTDGLIAALAGPRAEGILTGPPPNPYVASVSPSPESAIIPGRSTVSPTPEIKVVLEDGQSVVNASSVRLTIDGAVVSPVSNKAGTTTTITHNVTGNLLPALSVHKVALTFEDNATPPNQLGTQWEFAVGPYIALPANAAGPANSGNTPGFRIRTVQGPEYIQQVNNPANFPQTADRAIQQLNGTLVGADGLVVANEASPGTNADGSHNVDSVIDFSTNDSSVGNFANDTPFPGIPGANGHSTQFTTEVLTYLQLPAGIHRFGMSVNVSRVDVSDDDGYTLFSGANPRNYFSAPVGSFQNLTGGFPENAQNNNDFTFFAPSAGLYPFRLLFYQGGREASLEWYSVDPASGDKVLINDPNDARSIKAFRNTTAPNLSVPYIAEVSPRPNTSGNDPARPIRIFINDDKTVLNPSSIVLTLSGQPAVPSISKSGSRTTLTYQPPANRADEVNVVQLIYADTASPANSVTNVWEFGITVKAGPQSAVSGQWDFDSGNLSATIGQPLEFLDGANGVTATKTRFGTTTSFGIPDIAGQPANVMEVPGDLSNKIGYIMRHGLNPNGGGTRVNQYTIIYDIYIDTSGPGAASLLQVNSLNNTDDGDIFWQGNNFGQGGGGYNGLGTFTAGEWHRVSLAVDLAATPPLITKFVDGIKQDDWVQQSLDQDRRALKEYAILFGDGDQDERRKMYVNSIQIRVGKLSDTLLTALGTPAASGIPQPAPATTVGGQWDFNAGNLAATVGQPLEFLDGANGQTATKTRFGTTASLGIPDINGQSATVMEVPGDLSNKIGYIMRHGIAPNGGGTRVNQYTLIYDVYVETTGSGAAALLQVNSLNNTDDGDIFWQGNNFGQGGGGYNGLGTFTAGAWHRVSLAVDLAATPPLITKYVDGIKQDDWVQQSLDQDRRALKEYAILFGDGDQDERRKMYVNSIQIHSVKLSDAQLSALGGPSADGIPAVIPDTGVMGQWDFNNGTLAATVGRPLEYLDGADGQTATKTEFGTTTSLGIADVNGQPAGVMVVPGDLSNKIGYIMRHGIAPNGGGTRVNQYTLIYDVYVETTGSGAAALLQVNSLNNTDDGDIFWQGNNFGQGGGGYNGLGTFTAGAWHRVSLAVDLAATPPLITKYVDGIKQDDWVQQSLDQDRRALKEYAVLFGDGDQDERRKMYVNSIQIRSLKLSDAQLATLGGPSAGGIPAVIPETYVTGQWDFNNGTLAATVGRPLEFLDGAEGQTATKTEFGATTSLGVADVNGQPAGVMVVPGDLSNKIGYIMHHGTAPNGGGTRVNQYTLIYDVYVETTGSGAASLLQVNSLNNTDDGDIFWQGNNFGQGGGGYNGLGTFTAGAWHRVSLAVDLAATPPLITKFVDGIKQDDWVQQSLDQDRRALKEYAVLFGDGDQDERRKMFVNSIQIRSIKLSDAELTALGGPQASGIPLLIEELPPIADLELSISISGGSLTLSWPAGIPGVSVESTSDLLNPTWVPVAGITGNSHTVTIGTGNQFFRLRQQ